MKKIAIALLFLLSACAATHEPELAGPVKNQKKYEADLAACRHEAVPTAGEAVTMSTFGLLGSAILAAGGDDRGFTSGSTIIDKCMAGRGYKLAKGQ